LELAYEELKERSEEGSAKSRKTKQVLEGSFVAYFSTLMEWSQKSQQTVELVRCVSSGPAHKLTWEGEMEVDGKVVAKAEGQATKMDLKHLYVYLSVRFPFHFTLLQDLTTFLRCS